MKTTFKYFVLIIVLFVFLKTTAQKNKSLTGYFITLQNDTITCAFKTRNWKKQPFEIKIIAGGKDSIINPEKVKGFSLPLANIKYESILVGPALYELNMQFATGGDYRPFFDSARFVFSRLLYKGKLSLYLYQDKVERKHFFIRIGDEFTEVYKHLYSNAGGFHNADPIVEWYKQYILVLKSFMTGCKSLYTIIDAIDLTQENLIRILTLYDTCMQSEKEK